MRAIQVVIKTIATVINTVSRLMSRLKGDIRGSGVTYPWHRLCRPGNESGGDMGHRIKF